MRSEKIGVDAAGVLFGSGAAVLIAAGMMLSAFGSLNAMIASGARVAFAMGERRQLPGAAALGAISPKLGTPGQLAYFSNHACGDLHLIRNL